MGIAWEGRGVRHATTTTNWVKQYGTPTMCRPLESTAVRLATNRQGNSLDNAIETRADGPSNSPSTRLSQLALLFISYTSPEMRRS
jgi:hypothetical protein